MIGISVIVIFVLVLFSTFSNDLKVTNSEVLIFGIISVESIDEARENFKPTIKFLESSTGMKVTTFVTKDYSGISENINNGVIDFAIFGPFSYVLAKSENPTIEPIVVGIKGDTEQTSYQSLIISHKDSNIKSLDDLKNQKDKVVFGFVDPESTSGFLIPKGVMIEHGINPENDFKSIEFTFDHSQILQKILTKEITVGAIADFVYEKNIQKREFDENDIQVIWKSDPIPGLPIVLRGDLDESIKEKITNAFLTMHEQKNADEILGGFRNIIQYVPVTNEEYKPVLDTAINLGIIKSD